MKAVLPAAGFGTRFLPVSKVVPKELLPLGHRPVIDHVVAEAVAAGCTDILIILSHGKESIRSYFTPAPELEAHLAAAGKSAAAVTLRRLHQQARFHFTYQKEMRGLGDAVLHARDFAGSDPFAVLLADTVIHGPSPLPTMLERLRASGRSCVALEPCPADRVPRYGIAGGQARSDGSILLDSMVEKPSLDSAPVLRGSLTGHHAFAARYAFTPAIFDALAACPPGLHNEIQLTDAMRTVMQHDGFEGVLMRGRRLDIGTPRGLLDALPLFVE